MARRIQVGGSIALLVLASLLTTSGVSAADQTKEEDDVPRVFKGRLYFVLPDTGREMSEPLEVDVLEQNKYGIFTGTFSWYSPFSGRPEALCAEGVRVPVEGFYNGVELNIDVKQSAKHPLCRDFRWTLRRRGVEDVFQAKGGSWRIEMTPVPR